MHVTWGYIIVDIIFAQVVKLVCVTFVSHLWAVMSAYMVLCPRFCCVSGEGVKNVSNILLWRHPHIIVMTSKALAGIGPSDLMSNIRTYPQCNTLIPDHHIHRFFSEFANQWNVLALRNIKNNNNKLAWILQTSKSFGVYTCALSTWLWCYFICYKFCLKCSVPSSRTRDAKLS